jgi:hypothetical protein
MREPKKPADNEMLIVHKAPPVTDPDKAARDGVTHASAGAHDDLVLLERRLAEATDAHDKRRLLAQIQHRFGNQRAKEVVRATRIAPGGQDREGSDHPRDPRDRPPVAPAPRRGAKKGAA